MKIYKEIVYQVAGDKLVRVSEDSFEYSGEIIECKSTGTDIIEETFIPNVVEAVVDPLDQTADYLGDLGTPNVGSPNVPSVTYDSSWMGTGEGGTLGQFNDAMATNMGGINAYINQKFEELSEFLNPSGDTPVVTIDPDQSAYSGLTANKKAAELAANKAKAQARSSLRITA